jgi:metal-responsive CopG/Arc/MetJ family transcriptional regulator
MKTALWLPDSLFVAAERLAKRMGISRSELFQRAVQAFLREYEDEGETEALGQVYGHGSGEARLDPLLELLQLASLSRAEW